MVYETSRRNYFFKHNKKVDSWDASTIESTAFSMTVPRTTCTNMTTLRNIRQVHGERLGFQDFQIQPYEFNELRFPAPLSSTDPTSRAMIMMPTPNPTAGSEESGCPQHDHDNADMSAGVMVEGLASPLDFLKTIRYEEFLNDILGMEPLNCAHDTIGSSMSGEFLATHHRHPLQGDAEVQDHHEDHSDENCKTTVMKSQECGATTIHDVLHELTGGRMLLDSPSSPFALMISAIQKGDLWSHVHIKEDAGENGSDGQDWEDQENSEPCDDHKGVVEDPYVQGFAVAGTHGGGLPPRSPSRHTTVVKEFGVRRGRRLGPRRWVAHEITQNKPTPGMVVVSSPRNSETKLKSTSAAPRTPSSHRKKEKIVTQSLSPPEENLVGGSPRKGAGQRMSSLSRLSHRVTSLRQNRAYV